VLDHYRHPRNAGEILHPTASVEVTNPVCGDRLTLSVVLKDAVIREVKFRTDGCIPAVACASCLTEIMLGKRPAELRGITKDQIEAALDGLPPASHHASVLAADGLRRLLEQLRQAMREAP